MRRAARVAATAGMVMFAIGCADSESPLSPESDQRIAPNLFGAANPGQQQGRPERVSERLARLVPEFGGAFLDENNGMTVYLTAPGAAGLLRATLAQEFARAGRGGKPVRVVQGKFRFSDLDRWLSMITPTNLGSTLAFTEVDERSNRIRIGITGESGRAAVQRALREAGVPLEAAAIEVAERSEPYFATLRWRISPLTAGSEIEYQTPSHQFGEGTCTYGWNVSWQGRRHMLVNAHCTDEFGGPTVATSIFQPRVPTWNYQSAEYKVGEEVQDPNFQSGLYGCSSSAAPLGCRYADVALIEHRGTDRGWDLGGVLRTQSRTMLPAYYGTLRIDLGNPKFEMSGILSALFVGDTVNKIGRTTGWTAGIVESTCRNVFYGGRGYLCSGAVRGPAGQGDSGSPVFWTNSQGQHFVAGMLFSGTPNFDGVVGDNFNFANWRYIDYELGQPVVNDLTVFETTNTSPAFNATEMPADGSNPGDDPGGCVPVPPQITCAV